MNLYVCEDIKSARWNKDIDKTDKESALFAKKAICDFLKEKEKKIDILYAKNQYGKPSIEKILYRKKFDINIGLHFSLSHSMKTIICAVALHNIGADCQYKDIKKKDVFKKISCRFYSAEEDEFLNNITDIKNYIKNFYEIWVKKEAYIKFTGKGLAEGLQTFSVADNIMGQRRDYGAVQFLLPDIDCQECVTAICFEKKQNEKIKIIKI